MSNNDPIDDGLSILREIDERQRMRLWLNEPPPQVFERITRDALRYVNPCYWHFSAIAALGSTIRIDGVSYEIVGWDRETEEYLLAPIRLPRVRQPTEQERAQQNRDAGEFLRWLRNHPPMIEPEVARELMADFSQKVQEAINDNSPSLSRGLTGREPMISRKDNHDDSSEV